MMKYVGKSATGGDVYRLKSIGDEAIAALQRLASSMPHGTRETDRKLAWALIDEANKWRERAAGDKQALSRIDSFVRAHR